MNNQQSNYPGFSSFRELMTIWDEAVDRQSIQDMIEGNDFVLFFKRGDDIFASPEEGRLTFAKMKSPDEDMPEKWLEDATFAAINLNRALAGDKVKSIFSKNDLNKIKIIERDEAIKDLVKIADKMSDKNIKKDLSDEEEDYPEDPANSPTMNKVKERD